MSISELVDGRRLGNYVNGAGRLAATIIQHPEIFTSGGKTPITASIHIAANCNLRCKHCFLYGKEHELAEVEDERFLDQVKNFKQEHPSIFHSNWLGGEPLWRKELLRKAVRLFPINWVVTNGTIPIDGEWYNTAFFISIDGTRKIHNQIRQPWKAGSSQYSVYDRAKHTANSASAPTFVHTTINQLNAHTIPDLVNEWKNDTTVGGFQFSLHTPQKIRTRESGMSPIDERLFLQPEERSQVVGVLHDLKDQYGNFVLMTHGQIDLLSPDAQLVAYGKNCPLPDMVVSVDSQFQQKSPCVMGPGMDCNKCGCIAPTMTHQWKNGDVGSFLLNAGTFFKPPQRNE